MSEDVEQVTRIPHEQEIDSSTHNDKKRTAQNVLPYSAQISAISRFINIKRHSLVLHLFDGMVYPQGSMGWCHALQQIVTRGRVKQ